MGLEVLESGDDVEAVVDGLAAAAALPQYLPVLEPGDDVFDAGPDPPVHPVVVIADDPAGVVASRGGDRRDGAVAASPGTTRPSSSCTTVVRATMTSLRLPGQHRPTVMTRRAWAQMMIWVLMLRR